MIKALLHIFSLCMQQVKQIRMFLAFCLITVLLTENLSAQTIDSLKHLDVVEIKSTRLKMFSIGQSVQTIKLNDSKTANAEQLDDLLLANTAFYIKSIGVAGNSNISIRGTRSRHTAVLWNGVNLQSPLSNELNLFNVVSFMMDELSVHSGASSSLYGSGAVGGAIHFNTHQEFGQGIANSVLMGLGSFGMKKFGVKVQHSSEKSTHRIKYFNYKTRNDFEFRNTTALGSPIEKQENAAMAQENLMTESSFKISDNQSLSFNTWYAHTFRQLPPRMDQQNTEQSIDDAAIRGLVNYQNNSSWGNLRANQSILAERMIYDDPSGGFDATHKYISSVSEIEYSKSFSDQLLFNSGIYNNYTVSSSKNLTEEAKLNRFAIFSSLKYMPQKRMAFVLNFREELNGKHLTLPTFNFGSEIALGYGFLMRTNIAGSYVLPSFNDLFWGGAYASGNPDLLPERAWSEEFSLSWNSKFNTGSILLQSGVFNSLINNMIKWEPGEQGLWKPLNVNKVWSRGLENSCKFQQTIGAFTMKLDAFYNYVLSSPMEKGAKYFDGKDKLQLNYMPKNIVNGKLTLSYAAFEVFYQHSWIDKRYKDSSNNFALDSYNIANFGVLTKKVLNDKLFLLRFDINNVWNADYQSMYLYAMPKANYLISILIKFKQTNI